MSDSEPTTAPGRRDQPGIRRRSFLARTIAAGTGVAVFPQFIAPAVLGAEGKVSPSGRVTVV